MRLRSAATSSAVALAALVLLSGCAARIGGGLDRGAVHGAEHVRVPRGLLRPHEQKGRPDVPHFPTPPRTSTKRARIGQPITLTGGTYLRVTLLRVLNPLRGGRYDRPPAGHRYAGVELRLRNLGSQVYAAPLLNARLVMSDGSDARMAHLKGGGCKGDFWYATVDPSAVKQGCLPLDTLSGTTPARFEFTLAGGFDTAEWPLDR